MRKSDTENRKRLQEPFSESVIYPASANSHSTEMLRKAELVERLRVLVDAGKIRKKDIAEAINVSPNRITELFQGDRGLSLDEGATLVEKFGLESPPVPQVSPVPAPIARLLVLYVAQELGDDIEEAALEELAEDIRAFAEYVVDPKVRDSIEAAEQFFRVMRLRRAQPVKGRRETDHQSA